MSRGIRIILLIILPMFSVQLTGQQLSLAPPSTILDVQLVGTASWHMGSDDETGTVTLKARRDGKSRVDLELSDQSRSELRTWDPTEPHAYSFVNGKWSEAALHNAWVDPNWFLPQFSALATGPTLSFVLTDYGSGKIRAQRSISGVRQKAAKTVQALSTVDYEIDQSTGLPIKARWLTHPDDDYGKSIPVEVYFSDYRQVNGVNVPFKIQRYFNGTMQLEITISGVQFNTGLPGTSFTAQ